MKVVEQVLLKALANTETRESVILGEINKLETQLNGYQIDLKATKEARQELEQALKGMTSVSKNKKTK